MRNKRTHNRSQPTKRAISRHKKYRFMIAKKRANSSTKYISGVARIYNQEMEDIEHFANFAEKKALMMK